MSYIIRILDSVEPKKRNKGSDLPPQTRQLTWVLECIQLSKPAVSNAFSMLKKGP